MSHYTVIKIQCTHSVCDVSTYNQKQRRLLHNITHYDCMHSVTPGSYIPGNGSFLYTHANALKAGRLVVP